MIDKALIQEAYECYRFLIDHTNFEDNSLGYGLTLDRMNNNNKATIAGSGFMLSALVIGAVNGWDTPELNRHRALYSIKNFYERIPHYKGLFVHYADQNNGLRYKRCEYSTIDSVLLLNGMIVADSYFACPEISKYVNAIFKRIKWEDFIFRYNNRKVFRMAYNDIRGGDYLRRLNKGWIYQWNMMAEQLSLYVLAAPYLSKDEGRELFLGFERNIGGYQDYQFVYTPLGSLFVHQYSHAWFNFRKYYDLTGFDWYRNSVMATYANHAYCLDKKEQYKTFSEGLWGLSACDSPDGYHGFGAPPFITYEDIKTDRFRTDGTIACYAILASLPFTPDLTKTTMKKILDNHQNLFGEYGLFDSINLGANWISKDYYSIDKGISLLMIDNYYHGTNWTYYMQHPIIREAVNQLGFIRKEESDGNN